jgi:hypothetical protein
MSVFEKIGNSLPKKEDKKLTFSKKFTFSKEVQIFEVSEHRSQKAVDYFGSVETSWS